MGNRWAPERYEGGSCGRYGAIRRALCDYRSRCRRGQVRPQRSADRHQRRARQEPADRLPIGDRADQCQRRDPRPQGPVAGRGFDERRYRHCGPESPQADRARQCRFPARQRQLGDGDRARPSIERAEEIARRHRRPYRLGHRHRLPLERLRVCNTTRMETNSVWKTLFAKYGKKWYFITPDYAFGHTLKQGLEARLKQFGGTEVGASLTPLGAGDFSSYLIQAQAAAPDVIIFLLAGQDMVNALKQAVQFGLDKRFHIAGAQQELEVLEGLTPDARIGTWGFEWDWLQPEVPHVKEFVADIRKVNGSKVPTARHWFGYVAAWTCALVANEQKILDPVKLAKALENFKLPTEVALMPYDTFYRAGDHQLMPTLYVGNAVEKGSHPEDLFKVHELRNRIDAPLPVSETRCPLLS